MKVISSLRYCLIITFILLTTQTSRAGEAINKELTLQGVSHFLPGLIRDIGAIYRKDDSLIIIPNKGTNFLVNKYDERVADHLAAFHLNDSDALWNLLRTTFPKTVGEGYWRAALPFAKNTLLFLDGMNARIIAYDAAEKSFIFERSVILDRLKPPRDKRGEPTNPEIAAFRAKFTKSLAKLVAANEKVKGLPLVIDPERTKEAKLRGMVPVIPNPHLTLTGIAKIPEGWPRGDDAQFLVSSEIEGFSLMTMHCDEKNVSLCLIKRGCYLESVGKLTPDGVVSLAVSKKRNWLLIGDKIQHEIAIFKYDSCYHVHRIGTILLPYEMYELSAIMVDDADNLFIGTRFPDNYNNAALYVWLANAW